MGSSDKMLFLSSCNGLLSYLGGGGGGGGRIFPNSAFALGMFKGQKGQRWSVNPRLETLDTLFYTVVSLRFRVIKLSKVQLILTEWLEA